ncbi:MAG: hypothetical protein MRY74_10490 [Neomegalonema sp.]|nr:hypothetical protein [Neomegalonema sp.]
MNPELLRLARRELSPLRLIGAPIIVMLLLLYAAASFYNSEKPWEAWDGVGRVAFWAVFAIATLWGARRAADAVASELRDRTWDTQRLSGLGPAAMTVGKMLGAPLGAWYAVSLLLLTQIVVLLTVPADDAVTKLLVIGHDLGWASIGAQIAGAFAMFAAALFTSMTALAGQDRPRGFDTSLFQFGAVAGGAMVTVVMMTVAGRLSGGEFWGVKMSDSAALGLTFLYLGLWATLGAWNQMRKAFGVDTTGLLWILFLIALPFYVLGWGAPAIPRIAILILAGAAYCAVLMEPHRRIDIWNWLRHLSGGRLRAIVSGPAWIYAWLAAAAMLAIYFNTINAELSAAQTFGLGEAEPTVAPIAALLFGLRDMFICSWAGLRAKDGRGIWTALLILVGLWIALPAIGSFAPGKELQHLFTPASALSLISAAVQAGLAFLAVALIMRPADKTEERA